MVETYYNDGMKSAFENVNNRHGLDLELMQMEDNDGPYLTILIDSKQYTEFGKDEQVAAEVAQYIVDVHRALRRAGARVTYLVVENNDTVTVEVETQSEEV